MLKDLPVDGIDNGIIGVGTKSFGGADIRPAKKHQSFRIHLGQIGAIGPVHFEDIIVAVITDYSVILTRRTAVGEDIIIFEFHGCFLAVYYLPSSK
jgi:hypothetical protein